MIATDPQELTDRQRTAIKAVKDNPGCKAKTVAEAIEPDSDARGAAQTLRRLTLYVTRNDDGGYYVTPFGAGVVE